MVQGAAAAVLVFVCGIVAAADCNRNGVPDAEELEGADCNRNGVPDECEIETGALIDCDGNGIPDPCDIASGEAEDCDGNAVPDACDMAAPRIGLVGPERFPLLEGDPRLEAADLDGDGRPDLAASSKLVNRVSVLRGRGDGTFDPRADQSVRGKPEDIEAADLEGDGDLDLLSCGVRDLLDVLRNDGSGRFGVAESYTVGFFPSSLAAADLDGNGSPDIAVVNRNDNDVSVLLNDGTGLLAERGRAASGRSPRDVGAADLDGDGIADLAVASFDSLEATFLFGEGDGRFSAPVAFPLPSQPESVTVRDLDGGGLPEVAVSLFGSGITVLWSAGGRAHEILGSVPNVSWEDLQAGDLDGDGAADLVGEAPFVLWNDGAGGFGLDSRFFHPAPSAALAFEDFDEDGLVDLALAAGSASVLFNTGRRSFAPRNTVPAGTGPRDAAGVDLDRDGDLDLAVASMGSGAVFIFRNDGAGLPEPAGSVGAGSEPWSLATGDLDGDGDEDLAVANFRSTHITLLRSAGDGSLSASDLEAGRGQLALAAADLDADGDVDLAAALGDSDPDLRDAHIAAFTNDGSGSFGSPASLQPGAARVIATGDLDGDGRQDLVLPGLGNVVLLLGGSAGFTAREIRPYPENGFALGATARDVDGDGDADLTLLATTGIDVVHVLLGAGDGSFPEMLTKPLLTVSGASSLTLADLDRDQAPDLVLTHERFDALLVLQNRGRGAFGEILQVAAGTSPRDSEALDLDGDAAPDLGVVIHDSISVLLNASVPAGEGSDCDGSGRLDACELEGSDCNANGIPDSCDLAAPIVTAAPARYDILDEPTAAATADLDGDGDADLAGLVERPQNASTIFVLGNAGNGQLGERAFLPAGALLRKLRAGDLDGDGDADLVGGFFEENYLFRNGGDASLAPGLPLGVPGILPERLGDLDGDGDLDLVLITREGVEVALNRGTGDFERRGPVPLPSTAWMSELADVDLDGDTDVAVVNRGPRNVSVFRNQGLAELSPPANHAVSVLPVAVAAADLNGDGFPELAVPLDRDGDDDIQVFRNRRDGTFERGPLIPLGERRSTEIVWAFDIDSDGRVDLVTDGPRVFRNIGLERFEEGLDLPGGALPSLAHGDLDGDGSVDLVTAWVRSVNVLLNRTRSSSGAPSRDEDANGVPDECEAVLFHRGDANGDGTLDISDGLCVVHYLFLGGTAPACADATDANDDGAIDCSDAIFVLGYMFLGERPPPAPGPPPMPCGEDPAPSGSPGNLGCEAYPGCAGSE